MNPKTTVTMPLGPIEPWRCYAETEASTNTPIDAQVALRLVYGSGKEGDLAYMDNDGCIIHEPVFLVNAD